MPKLTARKVETEKRPGRYGDGHGLWLQVRSLDSKSWLFRYRMAGKAHALGLGPFPVVKLAEARDLALDAARQVRAGVNPVTARKEAKAAAAVAGMTFRQAAEAYVAAHKAGWRNSKHAGQWTATLATYAYPVFGDVAVASVTTPLLMRALDPIWREKPETATRVRGRIEAVLDYAKAQGWRDGENPARWRGHLDHLLPARGKVARVEHHPALPWGEVAAFMADLRAQEGVGARAMELTILTAARSGEAIGAAWGEFDLAAKIWTVPAARMKGNREHRVPLSDAALAALEAMQPLRNPARGDWVFPGGKVGKPLSNMAMTATLRRMGRGDITVHGFRSTFRDWCGEATDTPRELAEAALAHVLTNKVEAAYSRGDALAKRAVLMQRWADFCVKPAVGSATTQNATAAMPTSDAPAVPEH